MRFITHILSLSLVLLCTTHLHAEEYGLVSYYSDSFQGHKTASGERYDIGKLTAAHKSLPFGTVIKVTRLDTKKSVRVRINDRGPYIKGRIVEVSRKAAESLGIITDGQAKVKVEVVGKGEVAPKTEPATTAEVPKSSSRTVAVEQPKIDTPTPPAPKAKVTRPAPKRSTKSEQPSTPTPTKVVKATPPSPIKRTTTTKKTPEKVVKEDARLVTKNYQQYDLYKIKLMRPKKEGFGVQVASLSSYENVMKKVAELQGMWYKNILVSIEESSASTPIYKVILGPFPDEATATAYKKGMKKKNKINGFIVPLEKTGAAAK